MFFRKMIDTPKKIIISRTDNIGDMIFTFPMVAVLKKKYPDIKIILLARGYVRDIVESNPLIDELIDWSELSLLPDKEVISKISEYNADIFINVAPNTRLAKIAKKSNIPCRISRFRPMKDIFYSNYFKYIWKKGVNKHETQLVLQFLEKIGFCDFPTIDEMSNYISINPSTQYSSAVERYLSPDRFNLILHPGSNWHGKEWPTSYYLDLINRLDVTKYNIILTGSKKERERFNKSLIQPSTTFCAMGELTLNELIQLISKVDGYIGSGTGPTHLAAALGTATAGLFPKSRITGIDRWKPIGKRVTAIDNQEKCINCQKKNHNDCTCMEGISVEMLIDVVNGWKKHIA